MLDESPQSVLLMSRHKLDDSFIPIFEINMHTFHFYTLTHAYLYIYDYISTTYNYIMLIHIYILLCFLSLTFVLFHSYSNQFQIFKGKVVSFPRIVMSFPILHTFSPHLTHPFNPNLHPYPLHTYYINKYPFLLPTLSFSYSFLSSNVLFVLFYSSSSLFSLLTLSFTLFSTL